MWKSEFKHESITSSCFSISKVLNAYLLFANNPTRYLAFRMLKIPWISWWFVIVPFHFFYWHVFPNQTGRISYIKDDCKSIFEACAWKHIRNSRSGFWVSYIGIWIKWQDLKIYSASSSFHREQRTDTQHLWKYGYWIRYFKGIWTF